MYASLEGPLAEEYQALASINLLTSPNPKAHPGNHPQAPHPSNRRIYNNFVLADFFSCFNVFLVGVAGEGGGAVF